MLAGDGEASWTVALASGALDGPGETHKGTTPGGCFGHMPATQGPRQKLALKDGPNHRARLLPGPAEAVSVPGGSRCIGSNSRRAGPVWGPL